MVDRNPALSRDRDVLVGAGGLTGELQHGVAVLELSLGGRVHDLFGERVERALGTGAAQDRMRTVLVAERRELLLTRLKETGTIVAREVADELGLSEDSVRRDLRDLAAAGQCQRVYGGAVPVSPALVAYRSRASVAPESKRRVAARAVKLITPAVACGAATAVLTDSDNDDVLDALHAAGPAIIRCK